MSTATILSPPAYTSESEASRATLTRSLAADPRAEVAALVNAYRTERGLPALGRSATLDRAAQWLAEDYARNGYRGDHSDSTGRSFGTRMQVFGYRSGAGENIAAGFPDAAAVMAAWKASQPHNDNLLNASWRALGVGYAEGGVYERVWVQDFGAVLDVSVPPDRPDPPPPVPPTPLSLQLYAFHRIDGTQNYEPLGVPVDVPAKVGSMIYVLGRSGRWVGQMGAEVTP